MPKYAVQGKHAQTLQDVVATIEAENRFRAIQTAQSEHLIEVVAVEKLDGDTSASPLPQFNDNAAQFACVFVPLFGFVAAGVRAGMKQPGWFGFLFLSVVGAVFWAILTTGIVSSMSAAP